MAWAHGLVQISIHSAARAETITAMKPGTPIRISIHSAARAETLNDKADYANE